MNHISSKKKVVSIGAAIMAAGLVVPAAQATSVIDLPDQAGNTIQVNAGGDKLLPQFALWPLTGPNQATIHYEGNDATNRGAGINGKPWLLGVGAGNVIQLSTGGNAFVPQGSVFTDNNSNIVLYGNWAQNNGSNSNSVTGGQVLGHIVDGNGNVLQLEFFQGNVVNPQLAFLGDNSSIISTAGNDALGNGADSSTASAGALALVDGNGNILQIVVLSHNVINPQVSVGGSNSLQIVSTSNDAESNGSGSSTATTGFVGVFAITTTHLATGNVTQIAILSNNVWAPQIVLPGPDGTGGTNTSDIATDVNDAEENGNDTTVTTGQQPRPRPVIEALRSAVSPLTGGRTPILDALQGQLNAPPAVDIGNVDQTAAGSGNVDNPQLNLANHSTPDVVNPPAEEPEEHATLVRNSFVAVPGQSGDGGAAKKANKPNWKPGDGIKKVTAGIQKVANDISNALKPKPADKPAG